MLVSYERICYERNVSKINKFKVEMAKSPFWKDLMAYIKKHNIVTPGSGKILDLRIPRTLTRERGDRGIKKAQLRMKLNTELFI